MTKLGSIIRNVPLDSLSQPIVGPLWYILRFSEWLPTQTPCMHHPDYCFALKGPLDWASTPPSLIKKGFHRCKQRPTRRKGLRNLPLPISCLHFPFVDYHPTAIPHSHNTSKRYSNMLALLINPSYSPVFSGMVHRSRWPTEGDSNSDLGRWNAEKTQGISPIDRSILIANPS